MDIYIRGASMITRAVYAILAMVLFTGPTAAQNSTAATGNRSNTNGQKSKGSYYGKARKTGNQGNSSGLRLEQTSSSSPMPGKGYAAPGNIALMQSGQGALPNTRLEGFVKNSGKNDAIYGGEGELLPKYEGFDKSHRIETGIHSDGLTTNHPSGAPSAWDFPQ
jgi:hypothetical protein